MPLYSVRGTDLQFTIPDNKVEAYNRIDMDVMTRILDARPYTKVQITVDSDDLFMWTDVSTSIKMLWRLNPGCGHGGIIEKYEPRLVKV